MKKQSNPTPEEVGAAKPPPPTAPPKKFTDYGEKPVYGGYVKKENIKVSIDNDPIKVLNDRITALEKEVEELKNWHKYGKTFNTISGFTY